MYTVFDVKFDLEDYRVWFRHLCAPTHRPGPFEHPKFRIFFTTWSRSSKSRFFRKIEIKSDGGCYKHILTANSPEPFPDWSETKRVCPDHHHVPRNRFRKSTSCPGLPPLGVELLEEPSFDQNSVVSGLDSVGPQISIGCA